MDFFFNPRAVAVVGASSTPGKIGYEVLRSIVESPYTGDIYPINPNVDEILGLKAYGSIKNIRGEVDLAVFVLPAPAVPEVMEECGAKGVKGVVIISGGFKELGNAGASLERRTVHIAKKHGIRVIGPNCIGVFNGENGFDTFFQPRDKMVRPGTGCIALLTQSGTFGCSLLEWFAEENIGTRRFVSYGNKCDVDEIDMLRFLEKDPGTRVIGMYIEGLEDGRKFMAVAREVSEKKALVVLKAGRGALGARAARSHTGALSCDEAVFRGAMKQCGVIAVDGLEELFDTMKILSMQPLPDGNRVGMVTNGAGPCVLAVDCIETSTVIELGKLTDESIKDLRARLPPYFVFENPIDITGSATAEHYEVALKTLAQDPEVDILLPFFVFQDAPLASTVGRLHEVMHEVNKCGKPLVACAAGGGFTMSQANLLQAHGIPVIPTASRAIRALENIIEYANWLKEQEL
jgi:3-hydroxypropionyl-CoA synthetase (ADP-forming)